MKLRLFILSGLCAWIGVSCGGKKENTGQESIRPVRVVKVESLGAMQKMYTGVVQAEEYSKLAFKVSGPLVEMNVDAGQKVKKGTVIAAVDPLDYNLQFEANKAAYVTSKLQMERNKKLLAMQAISKQDYEIAEANYVKAKSAYETSQNTLADTKLRAPFDGFVEQKYVENYQKVDASPDGSGIPVRLAITDKSFNRDVYNIYPGFSCKVILSIDNETGKGYTVPLSAVFKDLKTDETSVWLYHTADETVKRQKVTTEQLLGTDRVLVTEGLEADDIIVVAGVNYIVNGQKVAVIEN